jgi:hypothetical protein
MISTPNNSILLTLFYRHKRYIAVIFSIVALLILVNIFAFKSESKIPPAKNKPRFSNKDSLLSKKAFLEVYSVLMSPRCMNCHPAGDVPLQGDDSHLHLQGVKRGPDGTGLYALKCANCHQAHNLPGLHMPPGNPKWHLPPANMKMVFQGRSPHQLALQLLDKKKNGGKSIKALIGHITDDGLVLSGWAPADGLSKPPLTHKAFVHAFNEWINHGAVSPDPERK